jgi:hypothetical protein
VITGSKDSEGHIKERSVYTYNPDYIFSLHQNTAESPWVITDIRRKRPESKFQLPENYKLQIGSGIQTALTTVGGWDLADIVRQPNFRVQHATPVNRDGLQLVQIDFECPHTLAQKPFLPIQAGTILLDPQQSWCVREYEVQTKHSNASGVTRSQIIQIRESNQPHFPLPVRIAWTTTSRATEPGFVGQTVISSCNVDYDLDESHPPTDEEFRLSAFGLPEPGGKERRTRWHLWAAAAAGTCLIGTLLFRWLARRAKSQAAS